MSYLNSLFTLDNPLSEGQKIIIIPKTFRSYFPWNTEPFCYKAHQTRAGLSIVLPHYKDGSLYIPKIKVNNTQWRSWNPYAHTLAGRFYLHDVSIKNVDNKLYLKSSVTKSTFHQETQTALSATITYMANAQGEPEYLNIYYSMLLHHAHFKRVNFELSRDSSTRNITVSRPRIETNMTQFLTKSWLIDYDVSLENVVDILLSEHLGPEEFSLLVKEDYLQMHALH